MGGGRTDSHILDGPHFRGNNHLVDDTHPHLWPPLMAWSDAMSFWFGITGVNHGQGTIRTIPLDFVTDGAISAMNHRGSV